MLLPLVAQPSQRGTDTTLDARLVNGYIEKDASGNVMVCKRGGFFAVSAPGTQPASTSAIYSADASAFYVIGGANLYTFDFVSWANLGSIAANATTRINSNLRSPPQVFTGPVPVSYFYQTPGGPLTAIVMPAPTFVLGSAFLDGTLYVYSTDGRVYGSNINDLNVFSALNSIVPQIEPDPPVALAKQLIYVVAFKSSSTEFFYDAGSPTGSPLLPVQNAKLPYGCASATSIAEIAGDLYFVSSDSGQRRRVMRLSGLKMAPVSTPEIDRLVSASATSSFTSWSCAVSGHTFYCVNLPEATLAYDVDFGVWAIWSNSTGAPLSYVGSTGAISANTATLLVGSNEAGVNLSGVSGSRYVDYNTFPINFEVITPNFDGGTRNIKVLSKMRFMCDQNSTGTLEICWSDDDYKTWSSWRSVNLQDPQPQLTDLGSFYQRAFWFRSSSPGPLRIRAVDLDLLEGSA